MNQVARSGVRVLLTVALGLAWSRGSIAQPAWVPTDIGSLGHDAIARAVNNHGMVVGDSVLLGSRARHVFLWTVGDGMLDLGTLGGLNAFGLDINDAGQIAGYGDLAGGGPGHAFFWSATTGFVDICEGFAYALNNQGVVVGDCTGRGAIMWSAATGIVNLGTIPGVVNGRYWATDVNDAGTVVGNVFTSAHIEDITYRAFVWTPSGGMALVDSQPLSGSSIAVHINNTGDIAAGFNIWLHDGTPRMSVGVSSSDLNNHGQVVGGTGIWSAYWPWGAINLGKAALGLNDAGLIVGTAGETTPAGTIQRAIVLRPRKDLAIDFGPAYGTYIRAGTTYTALHELSPATMTTGDLDGNGADDLILDFGGDVGVWAWMNRTDWLWIHSARPARMIAADLDGDLRDEVVCVFPGAGIWAWRQGTWTFLHHLEPTTLARAQFDGQQGEDLVANFAGYGVYVWQNDSAWLGIHRFEAASILTTDLDANGRDDLVIDFSDAGIWMRFDDHRWQQVATPAPHASRIAAGDIDGSGYIDLVVDFGPGFGVWIYRNRAVWTQLHPLSVESLTLADLDGTGTDEIILDFGASHGLWQYANDSDWSLLHAVSPRSASGALH